MELPEAAVERVLDSWPVARICTQTREGRARPVPIVFARVGDALFSPVDGKPKTGRELARIRDVRADPRVTLLLDHYSADWDELWWLRLDGAARVVQPATPESDPEVARALDRLRRKYPQYERTPILAVPPTLLAVDVTAIRSWCASPEATPGRSDRT